MTPAITSAKKAGIKFRTHRYDHDPAAKSYGEEAADKLGIPAERIFKTLVAALDSGEHAVGVVPVCGRLNLKALAEALGAKKSAMAEEKDAERLTGYVLGGISPLGQRKTLSTVIDQSALNFDTVFVSAGKRGLQIEISPKDLAALTDGRFALIAT
jgi:Cys-tRNA(Pro)/Cys-tRNA(Cys) deacylase